MSVFLQPIYTQTVGSGGTTTINFNNIPQTFTDLQLTISSRTNGTNGNRLIGAYFNGTGYPSNASFRELIGNGSSVSSSNNSAYSTLGYTNDASQTSNTFSSHSIYIPNYSNTSNFKQLIIDSVQENNATTARQYLTANLWRYTNAITSIQVDCGGEVFQQYTTFTIYGITKG
jgi:hypothetical protein